MCESLQSQYGGICWEYRRIFWEIFFSGETFLEKVSPLNSANPQKDKKSDVLSYIAIT